MHREVTERDFRMPEFRDADPKDYEFRADGKIVRKDRWETGIHDIRAALGDSRREFEIDDLVIAVKAIVGTIESQGDDDEPFSPQEASDATTEVAVKDDSVFTAKREVSDA